MTKIDLARALAPHNVPGANEGMSPAVSSIYALDKTNPEELRNTFAAIAPSPVALVEAITAYLSEWDKVEIKLPPANPVAY